MKIQLAPGEKLTVGFYTPAGTGGGWKVPQDTLDDGEFTIEYLDNGSITVSADLPDDTGRGAGPIYQVSNEDIRPGECKEL